MTENNRVRTAIVLVLVGLFNAPSVARADDATRVALSDDRAFLESITASSDGTLYVGNPAAGGVTRIPRGAMKDEPWIKPGAFDSRSTFGVLVDDAAHMLWVCSNDVSAFGVPGPSSVSGSHLKGFDCAQARERSAWRFPVRAIFVTTSPSVRMDHCLSRILPCPSSCGSSPAVTN
jgi:hypothetical protein